MVDTVMRFISLAYLRVILQCELTNQLKFTFAVALQFSMTITLVIVNLQTVANLTVELYELAKLAC